MSLAEWMAKPASPPPSAGAYIAAPNTKPSVVRSPPQPAALPPPLQAVVADTLKNLPDVSFLRLSYLKSV
jgi:hypothetical protein